MVHGDVNLGALMVHTSKNELLVADVASAVLELEQGDAPGRCGWYAPEQLKDLRERPSPRHRTGDAARQTDIWAVGVSALCIVARRSHVTNRIENQDVTLGKWSARSVTGTERDWIAVTQQKLRVAIGLGGGYSDQLSLAASAWNTIACALRHSASSRMLISSL